MPMKTAGIMIDTWKLPIFKRHLDAAKFAYTEHPGITASSLNLKVKCEWLHELEPVVMAANEECAQIKKQRAAAKPQ